MAVLGIGMILICGFMVCNILYKKTNAYKDEHESEQKYIKGVPENLQFVNMGSGPSHFDIDHTQLSVKSFSFAKAPQSFKYDLRLLKQYAGHIQKGAVVVVVIVCPLGFGFNRRYTQKTYNLRYVHALPLAEIDRINRLDVLIQKYFPLFWHPKRVFRIIKDINLQKEKQDYDTDDKKIDWERANRQTCRNWIYGAKLKNLQDGSQADNPRQIKAAKEKIRIMQEMLLFCQEKGFRPVIVIPPFVPETTDSVSQEFKRRFVDENIMKANIIKAPVLDYFGDKRWKHENFRSTVFMNSRGAGEFTKVLLKDIENALLGQGGTA